MFFGKSKFLEETLNIGPQAAHACIIILKSDERFLTRRYFKDFTIYERGGHLGHMINFF